MCPSCVWMYTNTCVCVHVHSFHDMWDYMYACEHGLKKAGLNAMSMKQQGHRHCFPINKQGLYIHTHRHRDTNTHGSVNVI